jgi:peptide deformylase
MKELVFNPDEILRQKSTPVMEFGSALDKVVQDATWVMRSLAGNALGITAIQTREPIRLALLEMDYFSGKRHWARPLVICNPEVMGTEGEQLLDDEGCLSFPGKFMKVKRPEIVRIRFWDREGKERYQFFHQVFARCVLHELDHMDGVLFLDRAEQLAPTKAGTDGPKEG